MQDNDMREKLEKIISAYEELQAKMSDPAVLADQKAYNHLAKEYANQGPLAAKAREYLACCSDIDDAKEMLADSDMKEFAQETIAEAESKMPALEEDIKFMLIPSDPADEKDIIVEIRAAAGGDEAAIFAGDLFKMYERFCSSQKWKIELMDVSPSEAGGYKEIQFKVKGDKVYSVMKYESGVHRVQRVPKTESQGRIHTSTATVAVLPEADEVEVDINENDLRIDVFRAGGPGGQCVNTTDSAVRITHLPTGLCRAVPGPEVAAAEQDCGDGRSSRAPLREDACRAAGCRRCRAPRADRFGRSLREDSHLQPSSGPRDRPPHWLQLHVQLGSRWRRAGRCHHRTSGGRPRPQARRSCLVSLF